jgi:hypothetical protein
MIAKKLLMLSLISAAFVSCKKDSTNEPTLQDRLSDGESPQTLISEFPLDSFYSKNYQGGYIFQMNSDGTGMTVSTEDISSTASWGCAGMTINGADGQDVGDGLVNCDSILSQCNDPLGAATLCDQYSVSAQNDWYLPSQQELVLIYQRIHLKNLGGLGDNYYWSSTEGATANTGKHILFLNGSIGESTKSNSYSVRAVRNF